MKLRFEQNALAFATATATSIANPQSSLPILANILVAADENGVTFEASDMECCVRCQVEAEVEQTGSTTVQAEKFNRAVRNLPPGSVSLDFNEQRVSIDSGRNHYDLTTQNPEDFPVWPDIQAETTITIEQAALKRILNHVTFALPQRDPRKVLLGALFDIKDNELICVATDGKKLGLSRCDLPEIEGTQPIAPIIPQKVLHAVQGNLKEEGSVQLRIGQRQVAFDLGNITYLSNRIDGMFPNYEMVIPSDYTREIRIPRAAFIEAIARGGVLSEERNNSIILRFQQGEIQFRARTHEVGSYTGSIEAPFEGEPFDIAFNHIYLTETFRVIDCDELIMKIKQPTAPVVFVDPENDRSLFLVMPIKLTDLPEFDAQ